MVAAYPKIDLRADAELIARVEALAALLSQPGAKMSRSAAARVALLRGLEALEAEHAATTKEKKKPARKPAK